MENIFGQCLKSCILKETCFLSTRLNLKSIPFFIKMYDIHIKLTKGLKMLVVSYELISIKVKFLIHATAMTSSIVYPC